MRSELVFTHFSCNQNCRYCNVRQPSDDRAFIAGPAVLGRIDAALSAGAHELVLTGGEPGMRRDLVELVRHASGRGAKAVVLETNATLIDAERAAQLKAAGLSRARVNLSGWGDSSDAVTRDPGGFARTLEGMKALIASGVVVEIVSVVVRSTLASVPLLPLQLSGALGSLEGLRGITVRVPTSAADPSELVSYDEAAATLAALEANARSVGLMIKVAADSGPPPCVFPNVSRIAHLYALTPGAKLRSDHLQPPVCAGCQMNDRCSGLPRAYLANFPVPAMKPVQEDRVRRRLSLISTVEEQVRREFVQPNRYTDRLTGEPIEEHLIRVNFHCNQACRFCFVSTHLPPATDAALEAAILNAAKSGKQVTLSGGEPTLNPRLVDYVKLAKAHSRHPVALQTNAIRLADRTLTDTLVEAGVTWVQVSLHGSTAALSDAMTEAPGTFEKTVVGIDNLHRHEQVYISINFVITQRNHTDLVPFVRLCARRWPRAFVNVSFVGASSDVVPKEKALVPRYDEVLPHLSGAIAEAKRLGVDIGGFESMCGVPLCLVPTEDRFFVLADIPEGYDQGEFVKPPVCDGCDLKKKCWGVRRGYFDLYGAEELAPVRQAADAT